MTLTLFLGCMYSGKSTALITHISRFQAIGEKVLLINHNYDSRCENEVKTHFGTAMPATKTSLLKSIDVSQYDIIGVDEGQFFEDLSVVLRWVEMGKRVCVAGLSGDYQKKSFETISSLIPHADDVQFKKALCMHCGEPASFSRRVVQSSERLLVGGKNQYEAVCRKHYSS